MTQNILKKFRCSCGRLLFKGSLLDSVVEIKCKKCGKVQLFPANSKIVYAGIKSVQNINTKGNKKNLPRIES